MCILIGCDYTESIRGMGPVTSLKLVKEHGTIDKVLEHIADIKKYGIPQEFPYEEARTLFVKPNVLTAKSELKKLSKVTHLDEVKLKEFLVNEKGFSEKTVDKKIEQLLKSYERHGMVKVKAARKR